MRLLAYCNLLLLLVASTGMAMEGHEDDPLLGMLKIDRLETAVDDGSDPLALEVDAWLGHDLHKLWMKGEVEREEGSTEHASLEFLYSRGVSPYWDLQVGWRRDLQPTPRRDWLALGLQGLAPYWFDVDATVYVGDAGHSAFELSAEYELLFTQRLILSPELEMRFNGYNDRQTGDGSGLASATLGLRLSYEIRREIAPYIGVSWSRRYGNSADFTRLDGGETSDSQVVIGLRAWF